MQLADIKNKRILILNDGRGISNYGLDLGSKALIELFEMGGNSVTTIPTLEFHRGTATNFSPILYRLIRPVTKIFKGNSIDVPYSLDNYLQAERAWFESSGLYKNKMERLIKESDVVVFNAEGSCHSNNYGARKGLFLLYIASKYAKDVFFMNGSITFSSNYSDRLAPVFEHVSKYVDMFYARENLSVAALASTVHGENFSYLPDSTFKNVEDYSKTSASSLGNQRYFLVSSSMNKSFGAFDPEDLPLGKVVDRLALQFGKPVFIVKDPEDRYISIFAQARGYEVFSGNDKLKLFSLFRHASFLFSGRFHHIILASINGCPSIAMNTTSCKNAGIIQTMPKLRHSQELVNPSSLLYSMDFILEQADILSNPIARSEAEGALLSFSMQQYQLLREGFGL